MSNQTFMSIMGLYNYDDTLFDNMIFPTGFTQADKNLTINNICLDCAELELLYPSWDMMHTIIPMWSGLELPVWQRIYNASKLEYNPIENYNRVETETVTHDTTEAHSGNDVTRFTGTDTKSNSGSASETNSGHDILTHNTSEAHSGTDTLTLNTTEAHSGKDSTDYSSTKTDADTGTDTTTNKITAYDGNTLYTHDTSDLLHGKSTTETNLGTSDLTHGESVAHTGTEANQHGETITHTGTDDQSYGKSVSQTTSGSESMQYGKTDTLTHGESINNTGEVTKESTISGNIGVTTSQQMLEQEIEISAKLNIIKMMVESFKQRFCILVY